MENIINVLVIVRWPVGGIRTYLRYVYNKFDVNKYHFTVIAPNIEEFNILMDDLSNINAHCIAVSDDRYFSKYFHIVYSELNSGRYDIVHSHGFTSGLIAAWLARYFHVPHIMTSHDIFRREQFKGLSGFFKKSSLSILLPFIDVIQAVSNDAKENILETFPKLNKDKNKVTTISNGIEIDRFKGNVKRDFRKELGLSDNTFLIGFLGRFMSQKGFSYLVNAIENIIKDDSVYRTPIVLAFGSDGFLREDQATINDKKLDENILFFPFEANISPILKGLDVLVMPSLWEACPLLPMEALVAGVPLIASDCIGLREVVENTPANVVKTADVNSLTRAMKKTMKNNNLRLFQGYVPVASKRYDVNQTKTQLQALYDNVLERH